MDDHPIRPAFCNHEGYAPFGSYRLPVSHACDGVEPGNNNRVVMSERLRKAASVGLVRIVDLHQSADLKAALSEKCTQPPH